MNRRGDVAGRHYPGQGYPSPPGRSAVLGNSTWADRKESEGESAFQDTDCGLTLEGEALRQQILKNDDDCHDKGDRPAWLTSVWTVPVRQFREMEVRWPHKGIFANPRLRYNLFMISPEIPNGCNLAGAGPPP